MKIVVGVDLGAQYEPALRLALRLGFPNAQVFLVHAVEPLPSYAPALEVAAFSAASWMEQLRKAGQQEIERARALAQDLGVRASTDVRGGSAAASVIEHAEKIGAELIAVGSVAHDRISVTLLGSVGRALTVGARQSVLVTKDPQALDGSELRTVFATDHSDYANRSLERLLSWKPSGIARISVLHAYDPAKTSHAAHERPDTEVEKQLRARTEAVAEKLRAIANSTEAVLSRSHPNAAIRQAMADTGSHIAILGAQGHGFFRNVFVGSVALHQVMREAYPVLLIRP